MFVGKTSPYTHAAQTSPQKNPNEVNQRKDSTYSADNNYENKDKFDQDSTSSSGEYTKGTAKGNRSNGYGRTEFDGSKSARQMKNEAMKSMSKNMFANQASTTKSGYAPKFAGNSTIMDALSAAEATSEGTDDYWGVEATSERIFAFAKNLAGEDKEMLGKLRDAFEKGFNQALGAKRGSLPSISYQTRDAVRTLFDDYEKSLGGTKTEEETTTSKNSSTNKNNNTTTAKKDSEKKAYETDDYVKKFGSYSYSGEKVSYYGSSKYGSSYDEKK